MSIPHLVLSCGLQVIQKSTGEEGAKQYLVKKDQELVHCCKEFAHMENNLMNARDPAPVPREVSAGAWLDLPEKLRVSSE
ncbi:19250_t:CDS:2 [Entrophospora sp. SA101]|nr:19250_t:CDS:2 [Entrophospora sp. SA101]